MCQNWIYLVRVAKIKNQLKFEFHAAFNIGNFLVGAGGGGDNMLGGRLCI